MPLVLFSTVSYKLCMSSCLSVGHRILVMIYMQQAARTCGESSFYPPQWKPLWKPMRMGHVTRGPWIMFMAHE